MACLARQTIGPAPGPWLIGPAKATHTRQSNSPDEPASSPRWNRHHTTRVVSPKARGIATSRNDPPNAIAPKWGDIIQLGASAPTVQTRHPDRKPPNTLAPERGRHHTARGVSPEAHGVSPGARGIATSRKNPTNTIAPEVGRHHTARGVSPDIPRAFHSTAEKPTFTAKHIVRHARFHACSGNRETHPETTDRRDAPPDSPRTLEEPRVAIGLP